jgi:hypothetical protein
MHGSMDPGKSVIKKRLRIIQEPLPISHINLDIAGDSYSAGCQLASGL